MVCENKSTCGTVLCAMIHRPVTICQRGSGSASILSEVSVTMLLKAKTISGQDKPARPIEGGAVVGMRPADGSVITAYTPQIRAMHHDAESLPPDASAMQPSWTC